jgi:hypothetical protein
VPLDLAGDNDQPLLDLVLLLSLFHLVTSSDVEPFPLALVHRRRSPSSSAAYQLGPAVESHDPGTQPLPDGAAWWANRWSSWLPHELFRSGGVLEPEGPASLEGSADGGPDAAREGVGEVGGVVAVLGASGPWGRPRGLMKMHAVRRITGAPTGPVTTEIWRSSSSSSSSLPSSSP